MACARCDVAEAAVLRQRAKTTLGDLFAASGLMAAAGNDAQYAAGDGDDDDDEPMTIDELGDKSESVRRQRLACC